MTKDELIAQLEEFPKDAEVVISFYPREVEPMITGRTDCVAFFIVEVGKEWKPLNTAALRMGSLIVE